MINRLVGVLSLITATTGVADTIAVDDFTPGTTISSSAMNSNFGTLVSESNENDARIAANEQSLSALTTSVNGDEYQWLGYTTEVFPQDGSYRVNGWNLSNHCKSQFGVNASVANLDILERLLRSGSVAAPSSDAWVLPSWDFNDERAGYAVNTFFNMSSGEPSKACFINDTYSPNVTFSCGKDHTDGPFVVACVAPL